MSMPNNKATLEQHGSYQQCHPHDKQMELSQQKLRYFSDNINTADTPRNENDHIDTEDTPVALLVF